MTSEVVVVMVPFVAQGHLNQLLHLSRLISAYNIPIHFVCTATHNRQARKRLHGWSPNNVIHFHDLPDPDFTSPPPDPNATTHFPKHLQPLFNSSLKLRGPVFDLITSISQTYKRVVVVHDALMSYVVQDVKTIPNAETYVFRGLSVFYYFYTTWEKLGRKLPFEQGIIVKNLPTLGESMSREFFEFVQLQYSHLTSYVGCLYDSSRVIEKMFLESLEKDEIYGRKHWGLGPLNPLEIQSDILDSGKRHMCMQWLDKHPASSVIYVSFGTTTTFTDDQIVELAIGLERSEQRFLWVLRDADKGDTSRKEDGRRVMLPKGFEERVEGRGLVVRDWVPQLEILGHLSTGGFVSHCGWNSCMEAMTTGVAVAAWPIHSDQPYNALLLSHVLGVALVMREWARRGELLTSEVIENIVRKLMDSKEGEVIKKRAAEFGDELRRSMADDGVTRKELSSFISYISR
ncbi:UDP-glucuronosyl/UDP-glucosyltransferase [Artemisia annua]|uniref:UDP-glucuronosyl/UDP-glucosyltransferase n=1 Tax=Artemisia annua TaxID=35608 RepID=A0A2U1KVB8_ARTAN|nr:UDP-glucuronosyl/UDP-glucosyltransferase [Artemisia annua]